MPLFVIGDKNGQWTEVNPKSGRQLLDLIYERYRTSATEFCNIPIRKIAPDSSLYVGQRECAVVPRSHADAGFAIIGSDDATTCHIIIFCHQASGTAAIAHFDGVDTPDQLKIIFKAIVKVLDDIEARKSFDVDPLSLDAYIVGGFDDARFLSEKLSEELLWLLHTQPSSVAPAGVGPIHVHLKLACISILNTIRERKVPDGFGEPRPAVYGAGIDIRTGEIFPCNFMERGPEAQLRSARHFSDERHLLNIYDHTKKRFVIDPFPFYPIGHAKAILNLPDEWILLHMSTSPKVEPPDFVQSVRDMLQFTISNPRWQDVFSNGAIEYEKRPGQGWVKVVNN